MKPETIVLSKPTRHYNAAIDGYTIEVKLISLINDPHQNAKRVILDGYVYPNKPVRDDYHGGRFGHYIDRVIFSGPMTIVFWCDGTKTRVRLAEGSYDDRANAIRWAMAKKYYGSRAQLEKRLGASRKFVEYMWDDNASVYAILMTLFGNPKKLDEYVNNALKLAEDHNEQ